MRSSQCHRLFGGLWHETQSKLCDKISEKNTLRFFLFDLSSFCKILQLLQASLLILYLASNCFELRSPIGTEECILETSSLARTIRSCRRQKHRFGRTQKRFAFYPSRFVKKTSKTPRFVICLCDVLDCADSWIYVLSSRFHHIPMDVLAARI